MLRHKTESLVQFLVALILLQVVLVAHREPQLVHV